MHENKKDASRTKIIDITDKDSVIYVMPSKRTLHVSRDKLIKEINDRINHLEEKTLDERRYVLQHIDTGLYFSPGDNFTHEYGEPWTVVRYNLAEVKGIVDNFHSVNRDHYGYEVWSEAIKKEITDLTNTRHHIKSKLI